MIQLEGHYLKDALHRAVVHGLVAGPNILPLLGRFPEQIQPGLEAAIDRGRQPRPSPFLRWQLNAWLVMYLALNKTFKQGELNPQALAGKNPRGNNSKGPDS